MNSKNKKIWYAANQLEAYNEEEINAVTECLKNGFLAGFGPKSILFEEKISSLFGKKYGLFVNSGSSANLLALLSLKLPENSEVITPACTFATTVAPIIQSKLKPVFCDVDMTMFVPTLFQIVEKITSKTRVIMIPNLIGNKPDWKSLKEYIMKYNLNIILIEDSCDTITYTPYTDISTTSFYASHLITAGGSGGMVMFNDEKYLRIANMYRDWGRLGNNVEDYNERFNYNIEGIPYDWKFLYGVIGYNFKCSEMNAAFGLAQLCKLDNIKQKRRLLFERYLSNLKQSSNYILPNDELKSDWLAFPLLFKGERCKLLNYLENNNIQTRVCFSGNITKHPAYINFKSDYINSDIIMKQAFLLGCHVGMSTDDVDYVCNLLISYKEVNNVFEALDIKETDISINEQDIIIAVSSIINVSSNKISGFTPGTTVSRSVFTAKERLDQIITQLQSIKLMIPSAKIFVLDSSLYLTEQQIQLLSKYTEGGGVILYRNDKNSHFYCNECQNKGLGEAYVIHHFGTLIKNKKYKLFCKLNGRNRLLSTFNINEFVESEYPVVKTLEGNLTLKIQTFSNFYSMPYKYMNQYVEHLFQYLKPETFFSIEHILSLFVQSIGYKQVKDNNLNIENISAVTGEISNL